MLVNYKLANGKDIKVDVSEEVAKALEDLDVKERANFRKETRRHQSLDASMDNGFDVADESSDIESLLLNKEEYQKLSEAIGKLNDEQKWLIEQVYFLGRSLTDIAKEKGVSVQAINQRLDRIAAQLKKYFGNF